MNKISYRCYINKILTHQNEIENDNSGAIPINTIFHYDKETGGFIGHSVYYMDECGKISAIVYTDYRDLRSFGITDIISSNFEKILDTVIRRENV